MPCPWFGYSPQWGDTFIEYFDWVCQWVVSCFIQDIVEYLWRELFRGVLPEGIVRHGKMENITQKTVAEMDMLW